MAKISKIKVQDKVYDVNDATKAVSQTLSSENLNEIQTPGFYSAPGNNTTTNKPTGVDAFGLIVSHNATGAFYTQVLYSANTNPGLAYRRTCTSGTWTAWTQDKYTDTNTDTKVTQTAIDSTYTAYRPVLLGASSGSVPTFVPTTTTSDVKAMAGIYVKPDQGILHATTFEGNLSGNATSATTASNASKVNNHTVNADVPSGAKFTDTTYGSATTTNLGLIRVGTTIVRGSDGKYNVATSKLTLAGTSVAGLMSADDKKKLNHIAENANNYTYSLPTASASVKGGVKIGSNLTMNGEVLSATNTTYGTANVTNKTNGLMTYTEKQKLAGIATGANAYTLPKATTTTLGGVIVGSNLSVDSSGKISATNTTYTAATTSNLGLVRIGSGINVSSGVISIGTATTSANGLMTKADKSKLIGLSNTPALAMGVAGYVPGTPSVSDTSNSNRYLSGGANGKGEWRALPSVTWNGSGLGKTFKNYKSGASVPTGYGTAATAPTVNAITSTSGRYYGVENDSNNRLFVNVPWTDTVGVTGTSVSKIRVLSPTQYNNLTTKSNLELYFILE